MTVSRRKVLAGLAAVVAAPYASLVDPYKPYYEDPEWMHRQWMEHGPAFWVENALRDAVQPHVALDGSEQYFGIMSVQAKTVITQGRQMGKPNFRNLWHRFFKTDLIETPDSVWTIGDKVRITFKWDDDDHGE